MWVRIPPAAPLPPILDIECRAAPPDVSLYMDPRGVGGAYGLCVHRTEPLAEETRSSESGAGRYRWPRANERRDRARPHRAGGARRDARARARLFRPALPVGAAAAGPRPSRRRRADDREPR